MTINISGFDPRFFDANYTLYYDETNNTKRFIIRENCFNVDANTHFVLGGIEAHNDITFDELKNLFQLQKNVIEVKSHHIYHGGFADCLNSVKLTPFLDLILCNGWHIHFQTLNLLYFSIVDIIDSIDESDLLEWPILFNVKSMLYKVVKADVVASIAIFNKYFYPDIKNTSIGKAFLQDFIDLSINYKSKCDPAYIKYLEILISLLKSGQKQDELIFIQNEKEKVLIDQFSAFYLHEVYMFKNSRIIFDNEDDIRNIICTNSIEVDGAVVTNYRFVDSKDNVMIQLSDIAVGIISKYLHAIDYEEDAIDISIAAFNDRQKENFLKLNRILKCSMDYNPVFIHQISSIEEHQILLRLIERYGVN